MALSATQKSVVQLVVGMFDAAPGKTYLDEFTAIITAGQTLEQLATSLTATATFQSIYPDSMSNNAFATAWVANLLGETVTDADAMAFAIAFVEGQLNAGETRAATIQMATQALVDVANDHPQFGIASAAFENQLQSAENYSESMSATSLAELQAVIANVTSDPTTIVPIVELAVEGETFTLTSGTDRGDDFTGTANDDQFNAYLAQNALAGGVSNTLSSADVLDGGAGTDTLFAEIGPEFFGSTLTNAIDVQPRTSNIENVQFEARDNLGQLTVDAKNMLDVDKIGSVQSDGDLVIENLTTLQSDGEARNTEDLTITMDHTDNFNSDNDASDLIVYFDEDYLLTGNTTSASQVNYWLLDENSLDYVTAPLLTIERTGVTFTIDGTPITVQMTDVIAAEADNWVDFAAGLQAVITASIANGETILQGLTVAVDVNNTDSTFNDAGIEVTIPAITITDANSRALVPTGFTSPAELTPGFDIYGTFNNVAATTAENPLAINVELNKVGREGEGGNLVIGGKELDIDDGAQDQGNGIGVFNIDVLGDATKLSNLGSINSTNNALTTVNIATAAAFAGGDTFASLTVRDAFDNANAVETVDANAFLGDLNIGQDDAALNVNTFTATGGGVVTYNAEIDGSEKGVFTNTTGAADDIITVVLDGDAVDTTGTSFAVNAGNGDNTVSVSMTTGNVSVATTAALDNLSITTGTGVDTIVVDGGSSGDAADGDADFNIMSGAESDMVHIRSSLDPISSLATAVVTFAGTDTTTDGFGEVVTTTITDAGGTSTFTTTFADDANSTTATGTASAVINNGSTSTYTVVAGVGGVTITSNDPSVTFTAATANTLADAIVEITAATVTNHGKGLWAVGTDTAPNSFADTVLYQATLTVNFAGFEQEVSVATTAANNFVATQIDINNAIKAAIEANPELARLLTTTDGTSSQQLTIMSTVEGDNDLTVTVNQPQLVAAGATGTQVNFSTADVSAMEAGLFATGLVANSNNADTAAEIIGLFTVPAITAIVATGDGLDGLDEFNVTNVSTIDMGTGTNDLAVLNSQGSSANTLDFSAAWGKVSVVNFFDDKAGAPLTPTVGIHILDFTAFLDDQTSVSGSTASTIAAPTAAALVTAMAANTVSQTDFTTLSALDGSATNTFANLTDAQVLVALQNGATYGTAAATANLVGTTRDSMLFVENNNNLGEYNVYNVELANIAAADATGITGVALVGVIDFGASIDVTAVTFA